MLYWLLMIDVSIFSMRASAFSLVCFQVLVEFWLYLRLGGNSDQNIQNHTKLRHPFALSNSFYSGSGESLLDLIHLQCGALAQIGHWHRWLSATPPNVSPGPTVRRSDHWDMRLRKAWASFLDHRLCNIAECTKARDSCCHRQWRRGVTNETSKLQFETFQRNCF